MKLEKNRTLYVGKRKFVNEVPDHMIPGLLKEKENHGKSKGTHGKPAGKKS